MTLKRSISLVVALLVLLPAALAGPLPGKDKKGKKKDKERKELTASEVQQFKTYFFTGLKEKTRGNYEMAAQQFQNCLKVDAYSHAAMYELSLVYDELKSDGDALRFIEMAVGVEANNEWYLVQQARLYRKRARFPESVKVLEKLTEAYPQKIDYLHQLAHTYTLMGKTKDAIAVYDKLEVITGTDEAIARSKSKLYRAQNDDEKAAEELEKLVAAFPNEPNYLRLLADFYSETGNQEKALETYKRMEEIDPGNPFLNLALADYYRTQNEPEKALGELKKAFGSKTLDIDTKVSILLQFYTMSEWNKSTKDDAYELNEILVQTHPDEAKAHSIYGDFLSRDKRLKEARDSYRKAVELDGQRFLIWRELLVIESELRDWQAMKDESEEAVELFPNQPLLYLFNGIANMQIKDFKTAIEYLELGKDLVVQDNNILGQFYSNLGDSYYNEKDFESSDNYYDKALQIDPRNVYVLNNWAYYLSLRGEKLEKAAEMSKKSLDITPGSPSYLDTYAWILYQQGKYAEARTYQEKAIAAGASSGVLMEHYGDILYQLGDQQGAVEQWQKAQELGGGSDQLERKIADKQLYE